MLTCLSIIILTCLSNEDPFTSHWAKVLPHQSELLQINFNNALRTGYHSSFKITKFYFHKLSSDNLIRYRFGGTHSKCSPSKVSDINYQCIEFSKSFLHFPLIRNGENVLTFFLKCVVLSCLNLQVILFPQMVISFASHSCKPH